MLFSVRAYSIGAMPRSKDGIKTLRQAQRVARQALSDGYQFVDILQDQPKEITYFGCARKVVETMNTGSMNYA